MNFFLYVIGQIFNTLSDVSSIVRTAANARRLRNIILIAAIYQAASQANPTSIESSSIAGISAWSDSMIRTSSLLLPYERPVAALLSQHGALRSVPYCLFDNGASKNITSFYHSHILSTMHATLSDGTINVLNKTISGLSVARFTIPDLALMEFINMDNSTELFDDTPTALIANTLPLNELLSFLRTDTPPFPFCLPISGSNMTNLANLVNFDMKYVTCYNATR